jgi:hypothetical protein
VARVSVGYNVNKWHFSKICYCTIPADTTMWDIIGEMHMAGHRNWLLSLISTVKVCNGDLLFLQLLWCQRESKTVRYKLSILLCISKIFRNLWQNAGTVHLFWYGMFMSWADILILYVNPLTPSVVTWCACTPRH